MDRGKTLDHRLRFGPLSPRDAIRYAAQLAQILVGHHAHDAVFGYLSPDRVQLHAEGQITVVLRPQYAEAPLADPQFKTDRLYLAPEVRRGRRPDTRSDVYSLGVVLYEIFAGRIIRAPRWLSNAVAEYVLDKRPQLVGQGPIGELLQLCLAKDPDERPTASWLVERLGQIAEERDFEKVVAHFRRTNVVQRVRTVGVAALVAYLAIASGFGIATFVGRMSSPGFIRSASSPAVLFSATWFSRSQTPRTSVNLADEAQPFLRVNVPYTLKFALQDREFPAPPIPDPSYRRDQLPSGGLQPGDTLEVSYFSAALEPSQGRTSIEVAPRGQPAVASFAVLPISSASDSSPVRLDVRFKGLPFYATVLHPVIIGKGQDPPPPRTPSWTRGAHAVAPAAAANYADRRAADVRILITPSQGDSRFSILIERPGTPGAVQGKSGLTPNELRDRLTLVRSEIEKLRRDSVFAGALDGDRVKPTIRQRLLRKLAELGWALHRDVFKDDALRAALAAIREASLTTPGMRVLIEHATADDPAYPKRMLLPFGLLYDDPAFKLDEHESAPIDIKHFWDYRYLLEVTDYRMMYWRGSFCLDNAPMRMAAVMDVGDQDRQTANDWRKEVESQKKTITALFGAPALFVPDEQNFRQIFRGQSKPFDLVYFYGHTNSGPNPSFDLTGNTLSIDQVREDARQNAENRLRDHPVVILNSCRGAAFSGDTTNTFLDVMADLKSSAFVATEASIGIGFGATVGERLLRALSTGKSGSTLLEVIWRMKHDALDNQDGNPMMLLYSVFGDPFVKVCSPKP